MALNISLFYHLSTNDQVVCPTCSLKLSSINQIVTSFNLPFHLQPHLSSLPSLSGRSQTFCTSLGKLSRYPLSIKQIKTGTALTNRNEPRVVVSTSDSDSLLFLTFVRPSCCAEIFPGLRLAKPVNAKVTPGTWDPRSKHGGWRIVFAG